jgi:hypothetical protein
MAEKLPRIKFEGFCEECRRFSGETRGNAWEGLGVKVSDTLTGSRVEMATFEEEMKDQYCPTPGQKQIAKDANNEMSSGINSGDYVRGEYYVNSRGKNALDWMEVMDQPAGAAAMKPVGLMETSVPGLTPDQIRQAKSYNLGKAQNAVRSILELRIETGKLEVSRAELMIVHGAKAEEVKALTDRIKKFDSIGVDQYIAMADDFTEWAEANTLTGLFAPPEPEPEPDPAEALDGVPTDDDVPF